MAGFLSVGAWLAVIGGFGCIALTMVYLFLHIYVSKAKKAKKKEKAAQKKQKLLQQASEVLKKKKDGETTEGAPFGRDSEVLRREDELKRDSLHVFRKLQHATDIEEKVSLCKEAVALFDKIEGRCGPGVAGTTSGRIVFCNALMECGGLDELRTCQDSKDPSATALAERVVPIIFST
mmetsp:Transcript_107988/g.187452  ORF Transcript_107988/g.187452 Transcript_107988/m.187452 type:complete len:178 (+) Transcript_107988:127-660(+)